MDFREYQKTSRKTARYPEVGKNFIFPTLGLSGETGEVAEKIKKVIRDKNSVIDDVARAEIAKELGDVLWYMAQLAAELGLSLDIIAEDNLRKTRDRMERGRLAGEGDNR